jgi:hypothetical protein
MKLYFFSCTTAERASKVEPLAASDENFFNTTYTFGWAADGSGAIMMNSSCRCKKLDDKHYPCYEL